MKQSRLFGVIVIVCGCAPLLAEHPNLLKNGLLHLSDGAGNPSGWVSDDEAKELDRADLPMNVSSAMKVTIGKPVQQHGYVYQHVSVKPDAPRSYVLSGYMKSSAARIGFLQIKMFAGKESRGLFNVGLSTTEWQLVSKPFRIDADVDRIQVLCRYYRTDNFAGKQVWFADVKLAVSEKLIPEPEIVDESKKSVWIVVVGDSTVSSYNTSSDLRGWGQVLGDYFQDHVGVRNLAKSGRSSKSFITEGLLKKAVDAKADFALIQFGHNDSHKKTEPKATDANTDFKDYLRQHVESFRKAGTNPILVTPMHRRTFRNGGTLADILLPYSNAMKEVATELKVPVIDLHTMSGALFTKLGDAGSADLSCSPNDRTHFSEKGAKAMAELVIQGLRTTESELAKLVSE